MKEDIERVKRLFDAEQRGAQKPTSATEIPGSYDAMTPEWLSDVLCRTTPGARVLSYSLGEVDNGSANRRRIVLEYNAAGRNAGLPGSVFCKASHALVNRINLGISRAAENEVNFYTQLREQLPIRAPHALYARFDPESWKAMIMLQDMTGDVDFCDEQTVSSFASASSQIDQLARLHGSTHSHPNFAQLTAPFLSWPLLWRRQVDLGMEEYCDKGFAAAESVLPASIYRRRGEIWALTMLSADQHKTQPQMITHNDVHLKNWYRLANGEMGLGDWHTLSVSNGARDFAYAMSTALSTEQRREWERDLLRLYLEKLREYGGPAVDFDTGWLRYRQQMMTALAYWTITLMPSPNQPDMQPQHTTMVFLRRIGATMEDLETLDSFS